MQRPWKVVIIYVATVLAACVDSSADRAPDVAVDPAAACTTYAGTWQTNATTFAAATAPAARVDFETRGDGVTPVPVGSVVPRDEYLSCCGILLDFIGPSSGGFLKWVGNTTLGFSVKANCLEETCRDTTGVRIPAGVRITFVPAVTAAGIDYPGGDTAVMFDAQNMQISTMTQSGSSIHFFIGYQSAVRIDHAEFTDTSGENVNELLYHRCL